jgi:hypothetical protein
MISEGMHNKIKNNVHFENWLTINLPLDKQLKNLDIEQLLHHNKSYHNTYNALLTDEL